MNFHFEDYILGKLTQIKNNFAFEEDVNIFVSKEQNFAQMDKLTPNTIYVVIKYLSSDIEYYVETLPIQLLVLSEQNSLEKAQMIMNKFAESYNWKVIEEDGIYIKQQYNSPVVLNNYVEVSYGYRSVLYVSGTLFVMENIIDIEKLEIDGDEYKALNFNLSYSMSTNTQQLPDKYIATSMKTVSTIAITLNIPLFADENHPLLLKVMEILNETKPEVATDDNGDAFDGNNKFVIKITFNTDSILQKDMRLISAQITTAPNQVPGIQLGFMV